MKLICLLIVRLQAKRNEARESLRVRNLKTEKREQVEEALEEAPRSEKWKIKPRISQKSEDRFYQA